MRHVLRRSTLPIVLLIATACGGERYPAPPSTDDAPVTDTLHGVVFVDPYRWLEEQESPETRAWIAAQNAYAETIVGETAARAWFRDRIGELIDRPVVGRVRRAGDHEYFTMRRPGEEMEVIYRRPAPDAGAGGDRPEADEPAIDGEYEVVLDPGDFDPTYRTPLSIVDFSPDGSVMAYSVREGGADEIEIRFRDLSTGQDLPDRLPRALYSGIGFTEDGTGVEYTHRSRVDGPRIRVHALGTPVEEDRLIWGEGFGPTTYFNMSDRFGDGYRIFTAQHGWARNDLYLQRGEGAILPLLVGEEAHLNTRFHEGRVWVRTDWNAPNYRLMAFDPANPDPAGWETVIAEGPHLLEDFAFIDGRIYVTWLENVENRIEGFTMEGVSLGEVEVPRASTVSISPAGPGEARVQVSSHLQPSVTYTVDLASGAWEETDRTEIDFDSAGLVVDKIWFESTGGARAPVYVVRRDDAPMDGSNPTILTGYGGFNVSIKPGFSTTAAAWVEAGGIYATATLRGGSEYGELWHRGGMLTNKQHVFDDFIAASERLIELGYTSPEHLGISGGSNGGLLVAGAMTQRPDLYRAVLCTYPDLDMVRFPEFSETNNIPALLEYGDARNPEHFEAIRRYSPYQAVEDGVDYPAVMLATGDLDTRVPPLQARKMTARLQAATGSDLPVILWYDERGGHAAGRGRPMSLRIEDTARELAFMAGRLGLEVGGETPGG
ncbi:MAG: prolyl oligopeptidase family serine peptidase [Longimicrobiales bacterium]|nr:prolyl oligopeptidase family serine peptidase [Longimicrobiales bacterium]